MKVYTFQTDNAVGDETLIAGKGGIVYKTTSINVINPDDAVPFDVTLLLSRGRMETILERVSLAAGDNYPNTTAYFIDPISQLKISCTAGVNITVIAEELKND